MLTGSLAFRYLQPFGGKESRRVARVQHWQSNASDVHIVTLRGELDIASAEGVADAIVEVDGSTVVVDLSGLTFMDSTGISALVAARRRILAEGQGQLVVTRPTDIVRAALEIVGLSAWIVEWSADWDE